MSAPRTRSCPTCAEPLRKRLQFCSDLCRLVAKIDVGSGDCWEWTAAIHRSGYGWTRLNGSMGPAHRAIYELACQTVPEGMVLDHLCRNRSCVNPDHLEVVTRKENNLRGISGPAANATKSACVRGHEFTPENTYRQPSRPQGRRCLACERLARKARWQATKAQKSGAAS